MWHHVSDRARAVGELDRVLHPEARILIRSNCRELSRMIRDDLIHLGLVDDGPTVQLSEGAQAAAGDVMCAGTTTAAWRPTLGTSSPTAISSR